MLTPTFTLFLLRPTRTCATNLETNPETNNREHKGVPKARRANVPRTEPPAANQDPRAGSQQKVMVVRNRIKSCRWMRHLLRDQMQESRVGCFPRFRNSVRKPGNCRMRSVWLGERMIVLQRGRDKNARKCEKNVRKMREKRDQNGKNANKMRKLAKTAKTTKMYNYRILNANIFAYLCFVNKFVNWKKVERFEKNG